MTRTDLVLVLVIAAATAVGYRHYARVRGPWGTRRAGDAGLGGGMAAGRPVRWRQERGYVPDAADLASTILAQMSRLGLDSLMTSVRVLEPHVLVTGAAEDIEVIRRFEPEVLEELVGYVAQRSGEYRWAGNVGPTLSYRVDQGAASGKVLVTRGPRAAGQDQSPPSGWPAVPGWPGATNSPAVGWSAAPVTADGPLGQPAWPGGSGGSGGSGGRRWSGARPSGVRLFRVGGGNIYHLRAGRNLIGRDQGACNIVCAYDQAISTVHLRLEVTGTEVTAHDMGSMNGTMVNGQTVDSPTPLKHGDEITIGETTLRLVVGDASLTDTRHTSAE